jgi:hypothetical protein
MRKKILSLSVMTTTTPRTPTESETTSNRDRAQKMHVPGRRLVVVFAYHHGKTYLNSNELRPEYLYGSPATGCTDYPPLSKVT